MIETPKFFPIFPSHAIERCAITVIFDQHLPQKVFERILGAARTHLEKLRFAQGPGQAVNIDIDPTTGAMSLKAGVGPTTFLSAEGGPQLTVAPNLIIYQTTKYVRWKPFIGEFERTAKDLLLRYLDALSVSHIKVEYWDRFRWMGNWSDFDPWQLLQKDSNLVSVGATTHGSQWHSHCGWFDTLTGIKRLTNVNVDTVEIVQPDMAPQPSVGIYTLMQDDVSPLSSQVDWTLISGKLDALHSELKMLLAAIIQANVAKQINLTVGST